LLFPSTGVAFWLSAMIAFNLHDQVTYQTKQIRNCLWCLRTHASIIYNQLSQD
jgi:hypothetical protein